MKLIKMTPLPWIKVCCVIIVLATHSQCQVTQRNGEVSPYKTSYACEGEHLNIKCPASEGFAASQILDIVRANFGRFSIAICNDEGRSDLSVNCLSQNTLGILQQRCFPGGPSSSCSIVADPKYFGSRDLCPETPKYLEVHYRCIPSEVANSESSYSMSTTTRGPPTGFTTTISDITSVGNASVIFQTPPPISAPVDGATIVTGKRRIPITPRPKVVTPAPPPIVITSFITHDDVMNVTSAHSSNGFIKDITSKFLSSSIASTNIMDTSELPMPIVHSEKISNKSLNLLTGKMIQTTPTTTTTTTTTTSTSTTTLTTTLSATTTASTTTTATTTKNIRPSTRTNIDTNLSKNKLVSKDVDIIDDDHDEQPDDSANNFSTDHFTTNNIFNAPHFPQASFGEKHEEEKQQEFMEDANVSKCPSMFTRGLEWPPTSLNQTAVAACPVPSSSGLARWTCGETPEWTTTFPDMSQCRSGWLNDILEQLTKQTSLVHLANEMEHQVSSAETLFGGDLLGLCESIDKMTDKMRIDLESIPTSDQRRAVVTEVVQKIIKTMSTITSRKHANSWRELGGEKKTKMSVTKLLNVLENAGLLLPEAVAENEEVTITSTNVLLSVKKMNFHHMGHTNFPSSAAVASKDWSNYSDHLEIPSLVLMEHMQRGRGITEIIFVSFKSLGNILQNQAPKSDKKVHRVLNSPIISLTMGRRVSTLKMRGGFLSSLPLIRAIPEERLAEPITIYFEHKQGPNATLTTGANAICVLWDVDINDWTSDGCYLVATNSSHSQCECNRLATFALMQQINLHAVAAPSGTASSVSLLMWLIILVLAICLSVILIMSVAVVILYCRKRRKNDGNLHKRLESSPSISVSGPQRRISGMKSSTCWNHFSRFCSTLWAKDESHPRRKRRETDLFPDLPVGSTLGRWQNHDENVDNVDQNVANTPTFFTDLNRCNTMQNDPNFMTRTRRHNLHLDLEPIPAMTLRGQQLMQQHSQQQQQYQQQQDPDQSGFVGKSLQPTRGSETRSRNTLTLNFQGYRKPFFPPKESVATPERPLLEEDFPSPDTASTTSHIYMEVTDPPHQSRSKWHQSGQDLSLQPIHRPLQQTLVDSSASSQSSGYGSSASPHFQDGQRHLMPSNQNTFHYDNVRGEMRGPFVRFQPEGGIATLSGHHGPRIHYPGQSEAFMSQSLHAGSGLGLGAVHRTPTVLDENKSGEVFLHDSQFV